MLILCHWPKTLNENKFSRIFFELLYYIYSPIINHYENEQCFHPELSSVCLIRISLFNISSLVSIQRRQKKGRCNKWSLYQDVNPKQNRIFTPSPHKFSRFDLPCVISGTNFIFPWKCLCFVIFKWSTTAPIRIMV